MKTFKEWMKETNKGNYVSVNVTGLPLHLVSTLPGKVNPEPHITLMYSKESSVPLSHVDYVLKRKSLDGQTLMVTGVDVFDDKDDEGNTKEQTGCLVLKVHSPTLNDIHNHLMRLGCKHSYADFKPHATLIYGCPLEQCKIAAKEIQQHINDGMFLTCNGYNNNHIIENWADTK
jgi:hypothetical protein